MEAIPLYFYEEKKGVCEPIKEDTQFQYPYRGAGAGAE